MCTTILRGLAEPAELPQRSAAAVPSFSSRGYGTPTGKEMYEEYYAITRLHE